MWTVMPIIEETGWVEIMDGDEFIGAARGKNSERNGRLMAAAEDMAGALHLALFVLSKQSGDYIFNCKQHIKEVLEKAGEL